MLFVQQRGRNTRARCSSSSREREEIDRSVGSSSMNTFSVRSIERNSNDEHRPAIHLRVAGSDIVEQINSLFFIEIDEVSILIDEHR